MRSASGSTASRVCMGFLRYRSQSFSCRCKRFPHACRRRAAGHVMDSEHVAQFYEVVEILAEMRIDVLQFMNREAFQLALFVESKPHRFTNLLMRDSER